MNGTRYAPRSSAGRAGMQTLRDRPATGLVGTDFDGTLAPIVADPAAARPVPGTVVALRRLAARFGTVAVITGRSAATAVAYAGLDVLAGTPGLVVLGHYGADRWDAATGTYATAPPPPGLAEARERLPRVLRRAGTPDGVRIEDKDASVAVHVRNTPDPGAALAALGAPLASLAAETGLSVEPGRLVVELRGPGPDKGAAIRALVAERRAGAVLFAGDDLGDVAAFAAVEALRADGVPGVTVASLGPEPVPALTERADLVLDGPGEVVAFLTWLATP